MSLVLGDAVKFAVNSLDEGIIDKKAAIEIIEDAAHNHCLDCKEKSKNDLAVCLMTLERAVDEEAAVSIIDLDSEYPLDSMLVEDAVRLCESKKMILHCEDGHVLGMYRQPLEIKTNILEVDIYGESKRVACI